MPEYLAPGVFVEEVSYRAKSIEGVSTTTTGFIGPARYGPTTLEPEIVTSLVEYERVYGDRQQLVFANPPATMHNYMWHAVRAFFENGGKRLYVQRVFRPQDPDDPTSGCSRQELGVDAQGTRGLTVSSRFPGRSAERRVRIVLERGPNLLAQERVSPGEAPLGSPPDSPPASPPSGDVFRTVLRGLVHRDVVWISRTVPPGSPPDDDRRAGTAYLATSEVTATGLEWTFTDSGGQRLTIDDLEVRSDNPAFSDQVRVVTATVTVFPTEEDGLPVVWGALPLDPEHKSFGAPDSLIYQFDPDPENREWMRTVPIVITRGDTVENGLQILDTLLTHGPPGLDQAFELLGTTGAQRTIDLLLKGGDDGVRPTAAEYEGDPQSPDDKSGLKAFEDREEISIVAAPGSTYALETETYRSQALTIIGLLISHCERMRYRIAVLDAGDEQSISQVRALRAGLDSKHAALYYPWVRVLDPVTQQEIHLPPSGFVAGIYARNDIQRAVFKAPANEVVTLALGFEKMLNKAQQEVLNPEGVNCFRFFEGRGNRLWGARTISSDPEWKYVNLRRYFAYLERSIDVGTQWAVFEPNGPALWANVRRTVSDFLFNEFTMGAFLGDKPERSYFVKCDRSTMTQNDIDNGRLVCLVGVAVVKPAEFVIFRIGQWTADARQ
jgi:phage tail sheath protein FI